MLTYSFRAKLENEGFNEKLEMENMQILLENEALMTEHDSAFDISEEDFEALEKMRGAPEIKPK
jgi:hypothetical protein